MTKEFVGLEGSVCLVTGAAKGIGEAVARKLHKAGMKLALADVDAKGLSVLAKELGEGDILTLPLDITDGSAVGSKCRSGGRKAWSHTASSPRRWHPTNERHYRFK